VILLVGDFEGKPQIYDRFHVGFPVLTEKIVTISVREMVLIVERPRRISQECATEDRMGIALAFFFIYNCFSQ
jgi:hypothetical protein